MRKAGLALQRSPSLPVLLSLYIRHLTKVDPPVPHPASPSGEPLTVCSELTWVLGGGLMRETLGTLCPVLGRRNDNLASCEAGGLRAGNIPEIEGGLTSEFHLQSAWQAKKLPSAKVGSNLCVWWHSPPGLSRKLGLYVRTPSHGCSWLLLVVGDFYHSWDDFMKYV